MKKPARILMILAALMTAAITGCDKETPYYPTQATLEDYYGAWGGELEAFIDNQVVTQYGSLSLYFTDGGTRMSGLLVLDRLYAVEEIQLHDGVFYFQVLNPDTASPWCQNWNLSGYAKMSSDTLMHLIISGKACGETGDEWISWEGDLSLKSEEPDQSKYFSFGLMNHMWNYSIHTVLGDSCEIQEHIDSVAEPVYGGIRTTTCDFPWSSQPFLWEVSPFHFRILTPDESSTELYAFHLDQVPQTPYRYYPGEDTNTVTLIGDDSAHVTAGNFSCRKYLLEQLHHEDSVYRINRGHIWISNKYGIIRYQAIYTNDTNGILLQELKLKNF